MDKILVRALTLFGASFQASCNEDGIRFMTGSFSGESYTLSYNPFLGYFLFLSKKGCICKTGNYLIVLEALVMMERSERFPISEETRQYATLHNLPLVYE